MLILTSLENAVQAFKTHQPSCVVSLLSEEEVTPGFDGLAEGRHIKLYMDEESCATAINKAAQQRARELLDFIKKWDKQGSILVHCNRGVSRSSAAAFIILCALQKNADESALLNKMRRVAPHIDPCPLFVSYADAELSREGRMLEAVEELGPPSPVLYGPTVELPMDGEAMAFSTQIASI